MVERSFEVADFQAIKLSGRHDVIVTTGSEESVRAEGDEESLDELEVAASGGTLIIRNRRHGLFGSRRRGGPVTVHVAMPELRRAAIAGSGGVSVNATRTAKVSIAGSGDVNVTGGAKCTTSKMGSGNVSCN